MAIDLLVLGPGVELVPDPEDPLVARREAITREVLREGIRSLSQLERDALRLTTRDKRPVSATAAELHTDRETVEAALRTGLLALRASLARQLAERAGD
jgi:DNA-directed RNA polymerase specialized sigma24 family protein